MSETTKAHAAMLVFAFLVSTSFTVGRALTFSLEPEVLTFARFLMALTIFSAVALVSKERFGWPGLRQWAAYGFLALILVLFFVTMFEGLRWTTPLSAGAVFTLIPFFTVVLSRIFLREKTTLLAMGGLLVAGAASVWIMFGGDVKAIVQLQIGRGEAIFLFGCIAYAGYAPAVKKLHRGGGIVYLTLWTLVAGVILLFAYGWQPILQTKWHLVSPLVYLGIGWLALFTTAITFYLIQYAALRLPGVKVMSYTLLIPAFVLLQRLLNGGAWPTFSVLVALVVLSAAMAILQRA